MGKLKLNKKLFNIKDICEEVVELQKLNADFKEIKINIDIIIENLLVYNDPNRLKQILINLLGNSIKFTESGDITLTVD